MKIELKKFLTVYEKILKNVYTKLPSRCQYWHRDGVNAGVFLELVLELV